MNRVWRALPTFCGAVGSNSTKNTSWLLKWSTAVPTRCFCVKRNLRGTAATASGKWRGRVTHKGKTYWLGTFDSEEAAHDAYLHAKSRLLAGDFAGMQSATTEASDAEADRDNYIGVKQADTEFEAFVTVNGEEISGGVYDSALEAGQAYDALARMYHGEGAELNFPVQSIEESWAPPDDSSVHSSIENRPGERLTVEEITGALKAERGVNVTQLDLSGRCDLGDWMVFATGRSVGHMRKMADGIAKAHRLRNVEGSRDVVVEGRDMDDWMVVDCGDIIVNIFDEEAREVFDLEAFYSSMKIGEDPWAGMTFDEWLAKNPVPAKWLRRLEQDEEETGLITAADSEDPDYDLQHLAATTNKRSRE